MSLSPRIVIYIPCYNAEKTVIETLSAIGTAIKFFGFSVPIIIYDDCSTDNSISCLHEYAHNRSSITIHKNLVNSGERFTTNLAFENLSKMYDWVLIVHADDIPKKEWLKDMYDVICKCNDNKIFTVWSSFDYVNEIRKKVIQGDSEGSIIQNERTKKDANFYITNVSSSWHISGAAINLKLFMTIGKFDILMPQYGDTDFYARALLLGLHDIYIRKTLIYYRLVHGSVSSISWVSNRDIKEIFYLSEKFCDILTAREQKKMLLYAFKIVLRRNLKYFIFGKWASFRRTISLTTLTFKKYISISFKY